PPPASEDKETSAEKGDSSIEEWKKSSSEGQPKEVSFDFSAEETEVEESVDPPPLSPNEAEEDLLESAFGEVDLQKGGELESKSSKEERPSEEEEAAKPSLEEEVSSSPPSRTKEDITVENDTSLKDSEIIGGEDDTLEDSLTENPKKDMKNEDNISKEEERIEEQTKETSDINDPSYDASFKTSIDKKNIIEEEEENHSEDSFSEAAMSVDEDGETSSMKEEDVEGEMKENPPEEAMPPIEETSLNEKKENENSEGKENPPEDKGASSSLPLQPSQETIYGVNDAEKNIFLDEISMEETPTEAMPHSE
ncbi:hypothetical protein IE077_002717, partial [Cardiosporidium cionae]